MLTSLRKEIALFLTAGVLVNITDFSIYYFLFHLMSYSMAKGISFTCAGLVGYLINKYWTFKKIHPSHTEIGRYVLINFLALGVNVLANQSILNVWPHAIGEALIIASMLTGFLTFVCFKWWVF